MKHSYLFLSSIVLVSATILLQSNADGPASNGNRAVGAPGDPNTTCQTCHNGGSFGNVNIAFSIKDAQGNEVSEYVPESTYSISVDVSESTGNPAAYGFQILALNDANTSTNSFGNPISGTKLTTSSSRQYAEHSLPSVSGSFGVDWTAPSAGEGTVTFYLGANAVNGNGQNSSDNAALAEFTIAEMADTTDTSNTGFPDGLFEVSSNQGMRVYPNPAQNTIQLDAPSIEGAVEIFNIQGSTILRANSRQVQFDVSHLESGIYYIKKGDQITKFMKQ